MPVFQKSQTVSAERAPGTGRALKIAVAFGAREKSSHGLVGGEKTGTFEQASSLALFIFQERIPEPMPEGGFPPRRRRDFTREGTLVPRSQQPTIVTPPNPIFVAPLKSSLRHSRVGGSPELLETAGFPPARERHEKGTGRERHQKGIGWFK